MAVYTHLTDDEIDGFVAQYALGGVLSCKGIAEGVENSNYLLVTETGPFILTLYERRVRPADLPFFVGLMEHLAGKGVACPVPIRGRDGVALRTLAGRPAAIVSFLTGMSVTRITRGDCAELGAALAALHLAGADFGAQRCNDLSVAGWRPLFESCRARADEVRPGLADGIAQELTELEKSWPGGLPVGVIHADLFPDNVFFRNHRLSGVIDFYFACTDVLAYDIAICLNAWCFEPDQSFNVTKAVALLAAYERVRPLSREELAALPVLARGSALRFLLTRLYDWLHTPADALVQRKDPLEYDRKLRFHRQIRGIGEYGLDPERLVGA